MDKGELLARATGHSKIQPGGSHSENEQLNSNKTLEELSFKVHQVSTETKYLGSFLVFS